MATPESRTLRMIANKSLKDKKWAFVSDYARLWIIYNNGGRRRTLAVLRTRVIGMAIWWRLGRF